jgi:7,8-dihydroneopterin aldolase/epimerase/oxygenase
MAFVVTGCTPTVCNRQNCATHAHTMDIIAIHDFRVETQIGFYDWERRLPQIIQLDLELAIPGSHGTPRTDRIRDTIDYGAVVARVRESLSTRHFILLEALSEYIADLLRKEFNSPWVRVSASKSGVLKGVRRVSVTIERGVREG